MDSRRGDRSPRPARAATFLSRARWNDDAVRDRVTTWAVDRLGDLNTVLVVDETGDEKSSTDAVGAARQYSGALGACS
ncbi:transposase [Streptosporangium album]|uniref:transposase n=1 Tax=Streptosporangium album TaxID=47479 RepID=UPI002483D3AA